MTGFDGKVTHRLFQLYRAGAYGALEERARTLLAEHPREPALYSLRGSALLEMGECEAAIQCFRQALTLKPGLAKLHNSLGIAYLRANRLEEAARSFGNAIDAEPQFAEPHFNLGLILENRQRLRDAGEQYRQAVQLDANYGKAWCAMAKVRWQMGHDAQVADQYEHALSIDPTHVPAHRGLLQFLEQSNRHDALRGAIHRARETLGGEQPLVRYYDGVIADIEGRGEDARQLLESCRFAPTDALAQHDERMRLARLSGLCDRRNDFDAAMQYAEGANLLAQAASTAKGIDKARFPTFIDNRLRCYTQENVGNQCTDEPRAGSHPSESPGVATRDLQSTTHGAQHPAARSADDRLGGSQPQRRTMPVFVIGFPRSGTTLIDTVLRGHTELVVAEESLAVSAMVNHLCGPGDEQLQSLGNLSDNAIEQARAIYFDTLEQSLRTTGSEEVAAAVAPMVVDRFALNIVYVGEIRRIFPKAKFILMLRHPADAVLSCYLRDFSETSANANFHTLADAAKLYDQVFSLWQRLQGLFALDVIEIKYEDLVANLELASRKALAFIDLPWQPGVLDHQRTARSRSHIRTASYNQVVQPIYGDAAGRWRRYRKHLEPILPTLGPWIEKLGYG